MKTFLLFQSRPVFAIKLTVVIALTMSGLKSQTSVDECAVGSANRATTAYVQIFKLVLQLKWSMNNMLFNLTLRWIKRDERKLKNLFLLNP